MGDLGQPHDRFFKALLGRPGAALALLRERLPPEVGALLADEDPTLLEGSFVAEELKSSETDALLKVPLRSGGSLFLYVLVEHQSTSDPRFPLRLLGYLERTWQVARQEADQSGARQLPLVLPLVVYHGVRPWSAPLRFADLLALGPDAALRRHLLDFPYTLVDLGKEADRSLSSQAELRAGLMALKYALRTRQQLRALEGVLTALAEARGLFDIEMVYILEVYSAVDRETLIESVRKHMPGYDLSTLSLAARQWREEWLAEGKAEGRAEGKAEGRAEGKAEGRAEGKADLLLRFLSRRFSVSLEVNSRIASATPCELDRWFDRALDARSLEEVFSGD